MQEVQKLFDKADNILAIQRQIASAGKLTTDHVVALESIHPGIMLDDNVPNASLEVTLEALDKKRIGFIAAALLFLAAIFRKLLSGGKSGSGGSGSRESESTAFAKDIEKVEESFKNMENSVADVAHEQRVRTITLPDAMIDQCKRVLQHIGKTDMDIAHITSSAASIDQYFFDAGKYLHDLKLHYYQRATVGMFTGGDWRKKTESVVDLSTAIFKPTAADQRFHMAMDMIEIVPIQLRNISEGRGLDRNVPNPEFEVFDGGTKINKIYDDVMGVRKFIERPHDGTITDEDALSQANTRLDEYLRHVDNANEIRNTQDFVTRLDMLQRAGAQAAVYLDRYEKDITKGNVIDKLEDYASVLQAQGRRIQEADMHMVYELQRHVRHQITVLVGLQSIMQKINRTQVAAKKVVDTAIRAGESGSKFIKALHAEYVKHKP